MQHLGYSLPTGQNCLPTTEAFFAFQWNFIIIVFLHCRHEMKYNCCLLFSDFWNELFIWFLVKESVASQRNSSMVAFETVHAGCYGGQQVKSITGTLNSLSRPNSRLPFKTEMITLEIVTECKLRLLERPTVFHFFSTQVCLRDSFYMKVDHHSYRRNFCSYEKKAWKISSCEKVASITAMISAIINFHIILHAAVHMYDFHI